MGFNDHFNFSTSLRELNRKLDLRVINGDYKSAKWEKRGLWTSEYISLTTEITFLLIGFFLLLKYGGDRQTVICLKLQKKIVCNDCFMPVLNFSDVIDYYISNILALIDN